MPSLTRKPLIVIEEHTPTREEISKFLKKIEQRIVSNNKKPQKKQEYETRL